MQTPMYATLNTGTHDDPLQEVAEITVIGGNFSGSGGGTVTSADITDATTVGKAVLTAADATTARTALGAGTSSLVLGTTSTTALAGNDSRLTAQAAGTASVRALGTTAATAAAGNDTRLLTGSATAINASTASDVAGLVSDFNALLTALRARGIITGT